jgi:hypothetical protein
MSLCAPTAQHDDRRIGFRFQKSVAKQEQRREPVFSAGAEDARRVLMVPGHELYQLGRYLPFIVIRQLGVGLAASGPLHGARASRFSLFS